MLNHFYEKVNVCSLEDDDKSDKKKQRQHNAGEKKKHTDIRFMRR